MIGIQYVIGNLPFVVGNLTTIALATTQATYNATQAVCDALLAKTQEQVPVDTGLLKSTGRSFIVHKESTPLQVVGEVSYNNDLEDEAWYAVIVHEVGHYHHDFPTKYKYVQDPLFEMLQTNQLLNIFNGTLQLEMATRVSSLVSRSP